MGFCRRNGSQYGFAAVQWGVSIGDGASSWDPEDSPQIASAGPPEACLVAFVFIMMSSLLEQQRGQGLVCRLDWCAGSIISASFACLNF